MRDTLWADRKCPDQENTMWVDKIRTETLWADKKRPNQKTLYGLTLGQTQSMWTCPDQHTQRVEIKTETLWADKKCPDHETCFVGGQAACLWANMIRRDTLQTDKIRTGT